MKEVYEGEKVEGRRHGYGTCYYEVGDVYEGQWEEGRLHGRGVLKFNNGTQFEGMWKYGQQHGEGIWTFADGVSYTGTWVDGAAQPEGTWMFADGTSRKHLENSGSLVNETLPDLSRVSCYKGTCTISTHDAVGSFDDGDPPTWVYPNGARYQGGWKDGKEHGYGIWKCVCGSEYHGYWENGMEHGDGLWIFHNGNRYTGEWSESWENGFGVLSFKEGHQYSGHWKNGKTDGKGEMTFKNGTRYEGEWHDGKLQGKAVIEFGEEWKARIGLNSGTSSVTLSRRKVQLFDVILETLSRHMAAAARLVDIRGCRQYLGRMCRRNQNGPRHRHPLAEGSKNHSSGKQLLSRRDYEDVAHEQEL